MRRALAAAALAAITVLASSGLTACSKVDRSGTKKAILKGFQGSSVTPEDQQCVANLIDKYSDSDLKKIDTALSKNSTTEPLAAEFTTKAQECVTGGSTVKKAIIDQLTAQFTNLTADQKTCMTDFINSRTADDFKDAAQVGKDVVAKCGITG